MSRIATIPLVAALFFLTLLACAFFMSLTGTTEAIAIHAIDKAAEVAMSPPTITETVAQARASRVESKGSPTAVLWTISLVLGGIFLIAFLYMGSNFLRQGRLTMKAAKRKQPRRLPRIGSERGGIIPVSPVEEIPNDIQETLR